MGIEEVNAINKLEKRVVSLENQISMLKQQFWELNKKLNNHINNIETAHKL